MAWTSSAGPEGTFALAEGANGQNSLSTSAAGVNRPAGGTVRPLAFATLAHLCGLAIVAPFAASNPVLAIPVVIGLSVAFLTLSRTPSAGSKPTAVDAANAGPRSESEDTEIALPASNETCANIDAPDAGTISIVTLPMAPLDPTEMRSDLRAELMARVSHELRTPLNAVMGFSDLMGHQIFGPLGHPRYEEYVSHIRESSQKLLKSAEDTLAMTSLVAKSAGRCEREPLPIRHLCTEAKAAVAHDLDRRSIACVVEVDSGIEVIAHRRALRQALVNVMCEAISQTDEGATLTVRASADLDRVALLVFADRMAPRSPEEHRSLPLCLARTLLELDGCQLYENAATNAPWSVLLSLDGAIQQELFARASAV